MKSENQADARPKKEKSLFEKFNVGFSFVINILKAWKLVDPDCLDNIHDQLNDWL